MFDMNLSGVSIGIKTFLRDHKLFNVIREIRRTMPDARMIVADDGEMTEEKDGVYADLARDGHQVLVLPFDSGFGLKSNLIADALQTPYILIGSDDFDFGPPSVRDGVEKLTDVLNRNPHVHIASGRVNNNPYEFQLLDTGRIVREIPAVHAVLHEPWFYPVDLTVNYSLIRKDVFNHIRWDDNVKIGGGEHGAFFVDCKRAGLKTVWVPGVNVNEQKIKDSERYRQFRMRARDTTRSCFDRRGIRKYILGNGQIDYDASHSG